MPYSPIAIVSKPKIYNKLKMIWKLDSKIKTFLDAMPSKFLEALLAVYIVVRQPNRRRKKKNLVEMIDDHGAYGVLYVRNGTKNIL